MPDGDELDAAEFSTTGPTSGDTRVRVNPYGFPTMGVNDSNGAGNYFGVLNHTFNTDNQSMQVVLADPNNQLSRRLDTLHCTIYMHSDTAHTVGSYCRIFYHKVDIGSYTRSGSTYTYTPFAGGEVTVSERLSAASRVEFRNNSTEWKVIIDNAEVLTVINNSVTFGASRRSAAVGIKRTELAGQPDELTKADGFWLYSVTMSDYLPQNYLGSGAKMSRTSGGAVSAVGTSLSVFPTNYFTTTVMATTDITVDPANAKFTVSVEGWYEVKLHVAPGASLATGEIFYTFLLKNGTAYEVGQYIAAGSTRQDIIEGNWTVYLVPGDYVQAGYQISITTASYFGAGDASSLYSLFNITLMNRSLV